METRLRSSQGDDNEHAKALITGSAGGERRSVLSSSKLKAITTRDNINRPRYGLNTVTH